MLTSLVFFERYVKYGAITLSPLFWSKSHNYVLRSDGSLRDTALISPLMFLIIESFGKMVFDLGKTPENPAILSFYNGNYSTMCPHYSSEYDAYRNELNKHKEYAFYLKTDIRNFYSSIDLSLLFEKIRKIDSENTFSQETLMIYKELFEYCANGGYPTIERSVALSFLAVKIFLYDIDCELSEAIDNEKRITGHELVRYQDDMYVVFTVDPCYNDCVDSISQDILVKYSTILSKSGLILNMEKSNLVDIEKLNYLLNSTDYVDQISDDDGFGASAYCFDTFISRIDYASNEKSLKKKDYDEILSDSFKNEDVVCSSSYLLNNYLYSKERVSEKSIRILKNIVKNKPEILSVDPRRITSFVTKTNDEGTIKALLNTLYEINRSDNWNQYYSIASISYLMDRNFKAEDLLNILSNNKELYGYCSIFCTKDFMIDFGNNVTNNILDVIDQEHVLFFLYSMYAINSRRHNLLVSFAYISSFFERLGKHIARINNPAINLSKYFKHGEMAKIYGEPFDEDYHGPIFQALELRNKNPIVHGGAEIIEDHISDSELEDASKTLKKAIIQTVNDRKSKGLKEPPYMTNPINQ